MKSTRLVAIAVLSLSSAAAFAQTSVTSQIAPNDNARDAINMSARNNYPAVTYQSSLSRAQVKQEARDEAIQQAQHNSQEQALYSGA